MFPNDWMRDRIQTVDYKSWGIRYIRIYCLWTLFNFIYTGATFGMLYLKVKYRREYFLPNGFCIQNKEFRKLLIELINFQKFSYKIENTLDNEDFGELFLKIIFHK